MAMGPMQTGSKILTEIRYLGSAIDSYRNAVAETPALDRRETMKAFLEGVGVTMAFQSKAKGYALLEIRTLAEMIDNPVMRIVFLHLILKKVEDAQAKALLGRPTMKERGHMTGTIKAIKQAGAALRAARKAAAPS